MALRRTALEAMGLTKEQVDAIIEAHMETVNGLKDRLKAAEEKAEKLDGVKKELDALKQDGSDYKAKYEKAKKDLDDFKADVSAKETRAAKEKAAAAYFEGKKITGGNLKIAMRGAKDEISSIELDGDKIKDTSALDALVDGEFSGLVVTQLTKGMDTAKPPANNGGSAKTKDEIMKIADTATRQAELAKYIESERSKE